MQNSDVKRETLISMIGEEEERGGRKSAAKKAILTSSFAEVQASMRDVYTLSYRAECPDKNLAISIITGACSWTPECHAIRSTRNLHNVLMATSLTAVGTVWASLSLIAAILCCSGFYLPFWIQGSLFNKVDAYFNSFRRCNYPKVSSAGIVEIIQECGRYSRFWDIPSPWWQASTILVGIASGLSLLIGITATAACCVTYVVHAGTARTAGFLQLLAALMVCGGVVLYPIGWDNREIKESCGESAHIYKIGNCNVSWSAYLLLGAVTLLLFCFALSFCACRIKPGGSFRI